MAKLLPILLLIIGVAIGGGVGTFLKPAPETCDEEHEECEEIAEDSHEAEAEPEEEPNYLSMKGQFVVPVIRDELVRSLVVMSLSLEVGPDSTERVFSKEPKLRDAFLRVLFDHAHVGGFNGSFTESGRLSVLRIALLEAVN